jgi:RNA 3'-terminal phosphate cyclase
MSVDQIRTTTLKLLARFGAEDIDLKIVKRGFPPLGGGQVVLLVCPSLTLSAPAFASIRTSNSQIPAKSGLSFVSLLLSCPN